MLYIGHTYTKNIIVQLHRLCRFWRDNSPNCPRKTCNNLVRGCWDIFICITLSKYQTSYQRFLYAGITPTLQKSWVCWCPSLLEFIIATSIVPAQVVGTAQWFRLVNSARIFINLCYYYYIIFRLCWSCGGCNAHTTTGTSRIFSGKNDAYFSSSS